MLLARLVTTDPAAPARREIVALAAITIALALLLSDYALAAAAAGGLLVGWAVRDLARTARTTLGDLASAQLLSVARGLLAAQRISGALLLLFSSRAKRVLSSLPPPPPRARRGALRAEAAARILPTPIARVA